MVVNHMAGEVGQAFVCPGKDFWLYPESNGEVLEGVKQESSMIKLQF